MTGTGRGYSEASSRPGRFLTRPRVQGGPLLPPRKTVSISLDAAVAPVCELPTAMGMSGAPSSTYITPAFGVEFHPKIELVVPCGKPAQFSCTSGVGSQAK